MSDPATLAYYQEHSPVYTASGNQGQSRHLEGFLERLDPGARILELGCGGGRDTQFMAERGFDVDATDGTPAMVEKARERTGLPVRVLRFDQIGEADDHSSQTNETENKSTQNHDAVWAHACLLHVARADLPAVLASIHRVLKPGGLHYANYKLGDGEGRDRLGRLHNFPDQDWITAAYQAANFVSLHTQIYRGSGADGTLRDWIALTQRKI